MMKKRFEVHKTPSPGTVMRTKKLDGIEYLVLPVVMMVEGVHNGSAGAVLHTIEELGKIPESWNGIPVTIGHPEKNGIFVSANSVDIPYIGRVYNTMVEGTKLKGEIYIDKKKITTQSPLADAYIKQGRQLEVSVGVFTEDEQTTGEWNGEEYIAIARNYRPDHLALLPGEQGACSWDDGCGVRVNSNKKKGGDDVTDETFSLNQLNAQGYVIQLMLNARSLDKQIEALRGKLNEMSSDQQGHWLAEAFEDYFIYEKFDRKAEKPIGLFKQMYSSNDSYEITLVGDPVPVERKVSYVQVNEVTNNVQKKGGTMSVEVKPCIVKRVDALIANTATQFTEDDRDFLQGLEEKVLDRMIPVEQKPAEAPQVNKQQAIDVLKDTLKSPDDFLAVLPSEMKDQFSAGLRLHRERRSQLIESIQTNSEKVWEKDELEKLDTVMLEKIAKSTKAPVDYSANGGQASVQANSETEEMLFPPGVKIE